MTISKDIGVPERTIRRWVNRHHEVIMANENLAKNDKVNAVLSTLNLPFEDKSQYCRTKGIMPEELDDWEIDLKNSLSGGAVSAFEHSKLKKEKEDLRKLLVSKEKELERKEKALAEAAALLLL